VGTVVESSVEEEDMWETQQYQSAWKTRRAVAVVEEAFRKEAIVFERMSLQEVP
jgi:hypothetical protein